MRADAQRIAIAKFCGWTECYHKNDEYGTGLYGRKPSGDYDWILYYNCDLNAVHEAEKMLTKRLDLWWDYTDRLAKIVPAVLGSSSHVHATADQRCEALLRTIGKWVEE